MKRVLVVDDAAFMRITIKNLLSKNGFEIAGEAENGMQAIAKCTELQPDIITMDITMPEVSGIEALKEIMKTRPQTVVIMVSAMGQEGMVKEAVMLGAKGFVVKPFKEEVIMAALSKFK